MFKGFNLNIDESFFNIDDYKTGNCLYLKKKKEIHNSIEKYLNIDGSLDATKISQDWFPDIKSDIFISHSHSDENLAIKLSGWIYSNLNLKCFIDSCVWGYSNDLLKKIDDIYCYQEDSKTYNYNKRNFSTSHVHMMLSTALINTIDNTECVIFINTPNSIENACDTVNNSTYSPWIYSELEATRLLRVRPISDYRVQYETKSIQENFSDELKIKYRCDLNHLCDLSYSDLNLWKSTYKKCVNLHALDVLYNNIR